MQIFVSSVRRGLELERDCLPGLIAAVGHDARRFEDFTAQPVPSREACLRGIAECDAYLLLLGPHYGHLFPETGQSATHDEWVAAVAKGMPRLVFRKIGVQLEPEQERFIAEVGDYGTGVFYDQFRDATDLQPKVAAAIRNLAGAPASLTFEPLEHDVPVEWRVAWSHNGLDRRQEAWLELHVIDVDAKPRSMRALRDAPSQIIDALRAVGALPLASGVGTHEDGTCALIEIADEDRRGSWNETRAQRLRGLRASRSGQVALWWSLPGDGLGSILDPAVMVPAVAKGLRTIGVTRLVEGSRLAIAIGLGGDLMLVSEGTATGIARTQATMSTQGTKPVQVGPDELISPSALDRGADEIAQSLVRSLLTGFRQSR